MRYVILSLILSLVRLSAATWYVDSSASGANNGTSRANAWTSFSGISTNTAAGDTILVYRGTGAAYARWTVAEGGTDASTRITVQGIDEGSGAPVSVGFNGAGFDYIAVIGMTFTQTSTATNHALIAWSGAVGWLVYDNYFNGSYRDAITGSTSGNNSNIIRKNRFNDIGSVDGGAAAGASGTSLVNINGNSNLIEYNTSLKSMDRVRVFGNGNVIRNNAWGETDTSYYPSSQPYPFHTDGLQSFEGTLALVKLLYERNYDTDNRDTIGPTLPDPEANGHSFIVQDGGTNGFNWYVYRLNVTIRPADSIWITRNVDTVRFYNNTMANIGIDHVTLYHNAVIFEGSLQEDYDFRNNTFVFSPKMIDAGGLISNSNRPSSFTTATNHSYNASGSQGVLPTGASPANLSQTDPLFTDGDGSAGNDDYTLTSSSPLRDAGAYITLANGADTDSTTLVVDDAKRLFDGWGIADADFITIGAGSEVQIVSIDYDTHTVTLAAPRTWSDNAEVYVRGTKHVGAMPYGSSTAASIVSGSVTDLNGSATITVSDSFNVRFVGLEVDGQPVGTSSTPSGNTYTVTWSGDGSANHTFTAIAYAAWASATPTAELDIDPADSGSVANITTANITTLTVSP